MVMFEVQLSLYPGQTCLTGSGSGQDGSRKERNLSADSMISETAREIVKGFS